MTAAVDTLNRWFAAPDPELLHADVEWAVPGYPVPREVFHGRDAVFGEFFPALLGQFAALRAETDELIEAADGERVTVLGRYVGTTRGGAPFAVPFVHIWTVRDGRVVRVVSGAHTAKLAEAARPAGG